ncbi:MAG TPA: carboxymuconolactone decarboxylase family protein [Burkholderiaceae bacterium]|jgi:AhpD family alkylhydroperoxidase
MLSNIKRMRQATIVLAITGIVASGSAFAQNAQASASASASATYQDIESTLGIVPGFFKAFPEAGIAGAWTEFKTLQVSDQTYLTPKVKQLIGLAVSAQVPCAYCVYFHTSVAKAYGATDDEIKEAVAMAAISRHWSTVLNGMAIDLPTFKREVDTSLRMMADKSKKK